MALEYTTVARILDIEPAVGSASISSAQIIIFGEHTEAEIRSTIAKRYALPLSGASPLIQSIATELTIYRLLSQRILTQAQLKDSDWPDRFTYARDQLKEIAEGKLILMNSAQVQLDMQTSYAPVRSDTMNYQPAVAEGLDPLQWQVDNQRRIDNEDDRLL